MSRIELRTFEPADAEDVVANANNPRVARYLREIFPSPYTLSAAEWWVTEGHLQGKGCIKAIIVDGECAGAVGATFFDGEHQYTAEIGYWIGEKHWGRGVMLDVLTRFTSHLFIQFELKRIYAPVAHMNTGSIRVLQKAGFVREAIFKNNMFLRGEIYDEHIYAKYP